MLFAKGYYMNLHSLTDVPLWLKSLRLHKYQSLFADMNYEEMLHMSEDYLAEKVSVCVCACACACACACSVCYCCTKALVCILN